ncbi:MAG: CRISPR-associated endoribonuclease Cas6 [Bacteroidetes bacterium]|nr:CRISPR-associated endoribonuclease Cas6 [Bacteroidota bacterium]MBU1717803.1 CRISPR-associated endoribonuclease Cas6 [Bacteroidota bacterium]
MRFHLHLKCEKGLLLSFNYQYSIASWIYSRIEAGSKEFSAWLHEKGYISGTRTFKLFTFYFQPGKYAIENGKMRFLSDDATLMVSFIPADIPEHFVSGLFQNANMLLHNEGTTAGFAVSNVALEKEVVFNDSVVFEAKSPIVLSIPVEKSGKLVHNYIDPNESEYAVRLVTNLVRKYCAIHPDHPEFLPDYKFSVVSQPKSRLVTIRSGQNSESKVRGFLFRFRLSAPPELLRVGYYGGFGEQNSMGFGAVELKGGKNG